MTKLRGPSLLAVLAVVVTVMAAGPASAAISSNAPTWWANPESGSANLRASWYDWDEAWIPGRGMTPDELTVDFNIHPATYPWQWSHNALFRENVSTDGILIQKGQSDWEIDMVLGNRQLHPYKLWYVEMQLAEPDGGENTIQRLINEGRFSVSTMLASIDQNDGVGFPKWVDVPIQPLRSGWDGNTWYAEFRIEPQPDFEKIGWTFKTNGSGASLTEDLRIAEFYTGTMCTPEPVSAVLLLAGLPIAAAIRRRRS